MGATLKWVMSDAAATVCALLLLIGAAASRLSLPKPEAANDYHERVRNAAAKIPMQIGDWSAADQPVPTEATDQLHPNVMISRSIHNVVTHDAASLLLVQSRDVRYIAPHYPPVCYPGSGLTLTAQSIVPLKIGDLTVNATRYRFESTVFRRGGELEVDNFMVLPDGTFQPDMTGMERRIGANQRYFGAAQIQVVHSGNRAASEETATTEAILAGYKPLIDAIRSGDRK